MIFLTIAPWYIPCYVVYAFISSLVPQVLECNQIAQAINLLAGLIPGEDSPKQPDASFIGKLFVFAFMWSLGALLELDDRKKVLLFFSTLFLEKGWMTYCSD